ncbi:MAG TPA: 2-hydroxyacid dehydrogenase [Thermoplasmata archaeon]|jgi:glycerate dehydrogenase|nr:2-hydroxyacid dehydrogenase [Thermoplasmata archaeon]
MARVLFTVPMDAERRDVVARKALGAFEPVILEDVPAARTAAAWASAEVLVTTGFPREIPLDLRQRARSLRLVQSILAGVDHLPFERLPPEAVVCSNAGAYNVAVAEHAMALLLAAAKDIPARTDEIRRGRFNQDVVNRVLAGSTVLILGMGGIGQEIARRCKAFGMRVVGVTRTRRPSLDVDANVTIDAIANELPSADFAVLALPLTRETLGLVDRRFLGQMKEDAVLVNIARGKIIVEEDLFEHLKAHPRFRAALDTWWTYPEGKEGRPFHRPFHDLPNVLMTPHVAPMVPGQRARAMEAALDNVLRFLRGEKPRNVVDPAEYAPSEPSGGTVRGKARTPTVRERD